MKKCREACEKMSPGEVKLATEQLNTNEVGGGSGGEQKKKLKSPIIGKSVHHQAKKTICSPNIITPIID